VQASFAFRSAQIPGEILGISAKIRPTPKQFDPMCVLLATDVVVGAIITRFFRAQKRSGAHLFIFFL
jgi:hypothetical protein